MSRADPIAEASVEGARLAAPMTALRRAAVPLLVGVIAFAVRLGPMLAAGGLQPADDDGGTYFGAAQHLADGVLPYRDFLFVQPPGITVLLWPFAAFSFVVQDGYAFAAVRVAATLVGVANAVLVARLLRRHGRIPALVGGLLYATWSGAAAGESTALLESLLNLGLLCTLLLWRRERRTWSWALVGLLLGVAMSIKIWAVADVVVLAPVLYAWHGRRAVAAWLGGVVAGAAAVIVPFAAFAPDQAWRSIVLDQLGRAYDKTSPAQRLTYFLGDARTRPAHGWALVLGSLVGVAILAGVVAVVVFEWRRRVRARRSEPAVWVALLVAHLALLVASPSFYYHYVTYAAAPLCLMAGWGFGRVIDRMRGRSARRRVLAACCAALAALGIMAGLTKSARDVRRPELIAFADRHRCVWVDTWQLLVSNDAGANEVSNGCATWVDRYAESLVAADGQTLSPRHVKALTGYQEALRGQFAASDGLMMDGRGRRLWSPGTRAWVRRHFVFAGRVGKYVLYDKR